MSSFLSLSLALLAVIRAASGTKEWFTYPNDLIIDDLTLNGDPFVKATRGNFTGEAFVHPQIAIQEEFDYDTFRDIAFQTFVFGNSTKVTSVSTPLNMTADRPEMNFGFYLAFRFLPLDTIPGSSPADSRRQTILQLGTVDNPVFALYYTPHVEPESGVGRSGTVSIETFQRPDPESENQAAVPRTYAWFDTSSADVYYPPPVGSNSTAAGLRYWTCSVVYDPAGPALDLQTILSVGKLSTSYTERYIKLASILNWNTGPGVVSRVTLGAPVFGLLSSDAPSPGRFFLTGLVFTKGPYFFMSSAFGNRLAGRLLTYRSPVSSLPPTTSSSASLSQHARIAIGVGVGVGGGLGLLALLITVLVRSRKSKPRPAYVGTISRATSGTPSARLRAASSRPSTDPDAELLSGPLSARLHEFDLLISSAESSYIDPALLPPPELLTDACCLSKGSYGQVFVVRFGSEAPVALKVVSLLGRGLKASRDLYKEIALLSKLGSHPNMVQLLAHSATDDKGYMVLELCKGTSVDMWLAPAVRLVVPDPEPLFAALGQHYQNILSEVLAKVTEAVRTNGHVHRFASLNLWKAPLVASSPEGQKALQQAIRGLTLIPALEVARSLGGSAPESPASSAGWRPSRISRPGNDPRSQPLTSVTQELQSVRIQGPGGEMAEDLPSPSPSSPPLQLAVQRPLLVLTVGPLVYSFEPTDQDLWSGDALFGFLSTCLDRLPVLSVCDRVRIATETWRAIDFLHSDPSKPPILHADIKPQNVLLTETLSVRVADVGLSILLRPFAPGQMSYVSRPVEFGTIGGTEIYQDPYMTGQGGQGTRARFGLKTDVYSFGMLLCDLFPRPYELFGRDTGWLASVLEPIVQRCVAPWDKRFSSKELLRALESLHDEALRRTGGEPIGPIVSESIRQLEFCMQNFAAGAAAAGGGGAQKCQ